MFSQKPASFVFGFWFAFAFLATATMQLGMVAATGGVGGLIYVGEEHSVRPVIEGQIPGVPLAPGIGHDGQLYYAIALDLPGHWVPSFLEEYESVGYRYRRIAFPALASLFGLLEGTALAWSMAAVNAVSAGVASGTVALLARQLGASPWVALAVAMNPGVWLSGVISTADNLALAAGLLAVWAFLRGHTVAPALLLALASLAKEPALLFAFGLVGYTWFVLNDRRRAMALASVTVAPLAAWYAYVHLAIGDVFDSAGNIGWPGQGIVEAAAVWGGQHVWENARLAITLAFLAAGMIGWFRMDRLGRWLTIPWVVLALGSSHLVWDLGNNAIRTLSPLIVLVALALAASPRRPSRAAP